LLYPSFLDGPGNTQMPFSRCPEGEVSMPGPDYHELALYVLQRGTVVSCGLPHPRAVYSGNWTLFKVGDNVILCLGDLRILFNRFTQFGGALWQSF
jgi:hypothetical protein